MGMKLTIGLVTMNREQQVAEAIKSCLNSHLPSETEFVVIDNASTDNTETVVKAILDSSGYPYIYHKTVSNIGAGGGRTLYYEKSTGEYIYGMDDDAVIDFENNPNFFVKAIAIMDRHSDIATLATQIYDTAWQANRQTICGKEIYPGVYKCKMFCGGSHFLRKSFFDASPYLSNRYGYEELPPSLMAIDAGMINAFCPDLIAIHKPAINKWDRKDDKNLEYLIIECGVPYAIKRTMYPIVCAPFIWLVYKKRCRKYLPQTGSIKSQLSDVVSDTMQACDRMRRIKIQTFIKMFVDFGFSIL